MLLPVNVGGLRFPLVGASESGGFAHHNCTSIGRECTMQFRRSMMQSLMHELLVGRILELLRGAQSTRRVRW